MLNNIFKFYKVGELRKALKETDFIDKLYKKKRISVFLSITIGYGFFYVGRLALSVAKKPMLDSEIIDAKGLGMVGSAMLLIYAFGKFGNGFLADRCNMKRFIPTGLLASALINLLFGINSFFYFFIILWAFNGWFQAMGSAPCIVSLSQWFSNKERGTYYGIWYASHNIGEGITFIFTAVIVSAYGWRFGFFSSSLMCLIAGIMMYLFMSDRPETYGLPNVADYKKDHAKIQESGLSIREAQFEVFKNPAIWILGICSACMYISRYAVNNWAVLFLQEAKHYSLVQAGSIVSAASIAGIFGSISCGFISDRFFKAKRNMPNFLFSIIVISSMLLFYFSQEGHPFIDTIAMALFGFGISATVAFLGGLIAVDISSKKATGAAMGMIGVFSYFGASLQDAVSGYLINSSKVVINGETTYNFNIAIFFWIGASIVATLLALTVWNAEIKD